MKVERESATQGGAWVALPRKIKGGAHWCKDYTGPAYHRIVTSVGGLPPTCLC